MKTEVFDAKMGGQYSDCGPFFWSGGVGGRCVVG